MFSEQKVPVPNWTLQRQQLSFKENWLSFFIVFYDKKIDVRAKKLTFVPTLLKFFRGGKINLEKRRFMRGF